MTYKLTLPWALSECPDVWKNFVRGMQKKNGKKAWEDGRGAYVLRRELLALNATYDFNLEKTEEAGTVTFASESDYTMFLLRWVNG